LSLTTRRTIIQHFRSWRKQ